MIYVDSCVPMYLTGAEHANKTRVLELLPKFIGAGERLLTSAEAYQELLHRYRAINDLKHLQIAYEAMEELVDATVDVSKADTDLARALIGQFPGLSSRDCLHVAIMRRLKCRRIWTYDRRFDEVPSLLRLE